MTDLLKKLEEIEKHIEHYPYISLQKTDTDWLITTLRQQLVENQMLKQKLESYSNLPEAILKSASEK